MNPKQIFICIAIIFALLTPNGRAQTKPPETTASTGPPPHDPRLNAVMTTSIGGTEANSILFLMAVALYTPTREECTLALCAEPVQYVIDYSAGGLSVGCLIQANYQSIFFYRDSLGFITGYPKEQSAFKSSMAKGLKPGPKPVTFAEADDFMSKFNAVKRSVKLLPGGKARFNPAAMKVPPVPKPAQPVKRVRKVNMQKGAGAALLIKKAKRTKPNLPPVPVPTIAPVNMPDKSRPIGEWTPAQIRYYLKTIGGD